MTIVFFESQQTKSIELFKKNHIFASLTTFLKQKLSIKSFSQQEVNRFTTNLWNMNYKQTGSQVFFALRTQAIGVKLQFRYLKICFRKLSRTITILT